MKFSDSKTASQMLLDAIAYDLQILAELEQTGQLFLAMVALLMQQLKNVMKQDI